MAKIAAWNCVPCGVSRRIDRVIRALNPCTDGGAACRLADAQSRRHMTAILSDRHPDINPKYSPMKKILSRLSLSALALLLAACAPMLLMPSQSQLMWALLTPLVGIDPNQVNLFEQPIIKQRMTALLGERYDTTMQLLRTASRLQQEGPLFFVVSRLTPIPDIAEGAGLVWNSETNQMAALVGDGKVAEVFAETAHRAVITQANNAIQEAVPVWPAVLQTWLTDAQLSGGAATH